MYSYSHQVYNLQKDQYQPRLERNLWRFRGGLEVAMTLLVLWCKMGLG